MNSLETFGHREFQSDRPLNAAGVVAARQLLACHVMARVRKAARFDGPPTSLPLLSSGLINPPLVPGIVDDKKRAIRFDACMINFFWRTLVLSSLIGAMVPPA